MAIQPVAIQPVTIQPVAIQPVAIQPVAIQPVASQSVAIQPADIQPVTIQTVANQPVASKCSRGQSASGSHQPVVEAGCRDCLLTPWEGEVVRLDNVQCSTIFHSTSIKLCLLPLHCGSLPPCSPPGKGRCAGAGGRGWLPQGPGATNRPVTGQPDRPGGTCHCSSGLQ